MADGLRLPAATMKRQWEMSWGGAGQVLGTQPTLLCILCLFAFCRQAGFHRALCLERCAARLIVDICPLTADLI